MIKWDYEEALLRLQVGDSFFIPTLKPAAMAVSIHAAAKREGLTVTCKEAINQGALGIRTWRLKDKVDTQASE
jgi:hypothetical protein